jgi:hypothetical protein
MKNIVLKELDITNIVKKSIEKNLLSEKFSVEPEIERTDRESELDNLFGSYSYHIPDDVIRYMRKNPRRIIERMIKIYGEESFMRYVDQSLNKSSKELSEGSADENDDGIITPEELYSHFDTNKDGVVTMSDYAKHVKFHCKNPDILEKYGL